jgi:hypothetical protein
MTQAVVADLSPLRPGLHTRPVHVGFVVGKVAQMQVFLRALPFSSVSVILPVFHKNSFIYHGRYMNLAIRNVVK